MAKEKKGTKETRKSTGRAIVKGINALMDARVKSAQQKIIGTIPIFIVKSIKPALKALDIPTKKDFKKISAKIASMDRSLNKLVRKKKVKVTPARPRKKEAKICKAKGCKSPVRSKGYCGKHYQAWRRGKLSKSKEAGVKACKIKGCRNKHHAKGYCWKHYMQKRRGTLK